MKFYLYTTGILNCGNIHKSEENIIDKWTSHGILANILSLIPDRYTEIHIMHSDICKFTEDITEDVNNLLLSYDIRYDRVSSSVYTADELNFRELHSKHEGKHYLLIDFAHLFAYPNIPKEKCKGLTHLLSRTNVVQLVGSFMYGGMFNLNSVYCSFIGNYDYVDRECNRLSSVDFMNSNFFTVNSDGTVTTYIDRMIELEYDYDKNYPDSALKNIYQDIKKTVIGLWKEKHGSLNMHNETNSVNTFDDVYNRCIPRSAELGYIFITLLMNGTRKDELIKEVLNTFKSSLYLDF